MTKINNLTKKIKIKENFSQSSYCYLYKGGTMCLLYRKEKRKICLTL